MFENRFESLIATNGSKTWLTVSRFHELSDSEILNSLRVDARSLRSVRLAEKSRFLVINIPENTDYSSDKALSRLKGRLVADQIGFKHFTFTNDNYIFIFLTEAASLSDLSGLLAKWCQAQGFRLGPDKINVLGSGDTLPIPLQSSFSWMNDKNQVIICRDEISLESAIALFLSDISRNMMSPQVLIDRLEFCEAPDRCADSDEDSESQSESKLDRSSQIPQLIPKVPSSGILKLSRSPPALYVISYNACMLFRNSPRRFHDQR